MTITAVIELFENSRLLSFNLVLLIYNNWYLTCYHLNNILIRLEALFMPRRSDGKMNPELWRLGNEIRLTIAGKLALFHQGFNFGVHKSRCENVKLIYGAIQELRLISDKFSNGNWWTPTNAGLFCYTFGCGYNFFAVNEDFDFSQATIVDCCNMSPDSLRTERK